MNVCRLPSEGTGFELQGVKFDIVKSSMRNRTFKAKAKMKDLKVFNRGDKFTMYGTKYRVEGFRYSNGTATVVAGMA